MSEPAPLGFLPEIFGPAAAATVDQVIVVVPTQVRGKSMMVVAAIHQPQPVVVEARPTRPSLPPLPAGPPWQVQVVYLLRPILALAAVLLGAVLLYVLTH